jgi:hypothetical protein
MCGLRVRPFNGKLYTSVLISPLTFPIFVYWKMLLSVELCSYRQVSTCCTSLPNLCPQCSNVQARVVPYMHPIVGDR